MGELSVTHLALVGGFLLVILFIFIVCREIVCWYFKINKTVDLMEQILAELKESNGKTMGK